MLNHIEKLWSYTLSSHFARATSGWKYFKQEELDIWTMYIDWFHPEIQKQDLERFKEISDFAFRYYVIVYLHRGGGLSLFQDLQQEGTMLRVIVLSDTESNDTICCMSLF